MFFRKRKLKKSKLKTLEDFRYSLEYNIRKLKEDESNKIFMHYTIIDGIFNIHHSGFRVNLKDRIEHERYKIKYLKTEFPEIYEDFTKILNREKKINNILKE